MKFTKLKDEDIIAKNNSINPFKNCIEVTHKNESK